MALSASCITFTFIIYAEKKQEGQSERGRESKRERGREGEREQKRERERVYEAHKCKMRV